MSWSVSPWSALYNSSKKAKYDSIPHSPKTKICLAFPEFFLYCNLEYFVISNKTLNLVCIGFMIKIKAKTVKIIIYLESHILGVISPYPSVVKVTKPKYIASWKLIKFSKPFPL